MLGKTIGALVFIIVLIVIIFVSPVFKVKTISVAEGSCVSSHEINLKNRNIFLVSKKDSDKLKEKFLCIQNIEIKKQYPNKLILNVVSIQTVAKIGNSEKYITENGLIVDSANTNKQLPIIFFPDNIKMDQLQKTEDKLSLYVLDLTKNLTKSDFTLMNLRILANDNIVAYNNYGQIAIFTSTKDIIWQVDSLQLVLSTAKIDGTKIEKIDLRFDKPVIVYKK